MSFAQYCISMPPSLVYPAESLSRTLQSAPSDSSLAEAKVTDLLKVSLDELKGEGNAARSRASESKSVLNLMKYFIRGLADVYGMQDEVDHEGLEKKVRFYFILFFWGGGTSSKRKERLRAFISKFAPPSTHAATRTCMLVLCINVSASQSFSLYQNSCRW